MARWALVSGLQGDLELYELIQRDLRQLGRIDTLFVLGDLIGPDRQANALLDRLRDPRRGELAPQCIYGWWEDQWLAERGYRGERRADLLRQQFGQAAVEALERVVDSAHLEWLAALQFGFIELDCALLHGSSADVGDRLGPESSPLLLLDRLTRMDVNRLFTARSGEQFCVELAGGGIASTVRDLAGERQLEQAVPQRKVIGIGSGPRYTLYDPGNDRITFRSVGQQVGSRGRGFA